MTTLKKRLAAAASTAVMFASMASPAFAATTIEVSGNGASSDNTAKVETSNNTVVTQSNNAVVTNTVNSSSNTGGNKANQNTNGDVLVRTGDATTKVEIENQLNRNTASVDCCAAQDADVLISGNGAYSDNDAKLKQQANNSVFQDNKANVANNVDGYAKTGKNDANQNTGGDIAISTGDAKTEVSVSTVANQNWAVVGSEGHNGEITARILGNGVHSDNDIRLDIERNSVLVQDNLANIVNAVDAYAKTGYNDANQNTNGEVTILTGHAKTDVSIDNMVNFNHASLDCGCETDLLAKVANNGAETDNYIKFDLENEKEVFQDNAALLANELDGYAKTGHNDADQNVGGYEGTDPAIWTGDASSMVDVENSGNVNTYGVEHAPTTWPDFDFSFSFNLSLNDLLSLAR